MPIQVFFNYCEESRKWTVVVNGAADPTEARQAFSAVILTCQKLNPDLLELTKVLPTIDGEFEINPAV